MRCACSITSGFDRGSAARGWSRSALVVAEVALAFVLAAGAGLMIRTLSGLLRTSSGLAAPERVLVADVNLPPARYPKERIAAFAQQLLQRLTVAPGVRSGALMTSVPLDPRARNEFGFILEGGEPSPPGQSPKTEILWATPGYLDALGIPLLRGRDLRWTDVKTAPQVVLVNDAFVRRFIPQGEPIGRRVSEVLGPGNDPWEIAGVIGDVRTRGLDRVPAPLLVIPLLQYPVPSLRLAVRGTSGDPLQLLSLLRTEVLALDKDIRMALGADSSLVVRMVVGGGLRLALLGVGLGLVGALFGTRVLASLVYQVSTTDPLTLAATAAVLVASAVLASWIPARRATRVDPAISLRAE